MSNYNLYQQLGRCGVLLFLASIAREDMKEKRISVKLILGFASISIIYLFFDSHLSYIKIVTAVMPGMLLLLLSFITKESIGYGDGFTVLIIGLWLGGFLTGIMVCLAVLLAGVYACYRLAKRSKEDIPFVPFLLVAFEVMVGYGI